MKKYLRLGLFGFLVWLIPFVVSFFIFGLKTSLPTLFESIMPVVVVICTVVFSAVYLRKVKADFLKEGIVVGIVWLVICLVFDLLLFMEGPMKMSFADYMMDIGLVYLTIPTITVGFGWLLGKSSERLVVEQGQG